jgi:hypothetical protein
MNTDFFINKYKISKRLFGGDHMNVNADLVDKYVSLTKTKNYLSSQISIITIGFLLALLEETAESIRNR